jgi:hypothetical protein
VVVVVVVHGQVAAGLLLAFVRLHLLAHLKDGCNKFSEIRGERSR